MITMVTGSLTVSLSNSDSDGNKNGNKPIGLDWQNNNFARHHAFLYISLPSLHDYDVKMPNFTFRRFIEDGKTKQQFSFSFPEL